MSNNNSEIGYGNSISGDLFFDQPNCEGAAFVNSEADRSYVMFARGAPNEFYISGGSQNYEPKIVNSYWYGGSCREKNQVLSRAAYLVVPYIPAEEITSATYPLTLEQMP